MPKCSLMCVKRVSNGYKEVGYQEDFLNSNLAPFVGSGRWSSDNIPVDMVYVDECKQSSELCKNPQSCRDMPYGYNCLSADFTGKCDSLSTTVFTLLYRKSSWCCININ